MKYLNYLLCMIMLVTLGVACTENPGNFPIDLEEIHDPANTGGFLRIITEEGDSWNMSDIENEEYSLTLEADDAENGGQLESVDFYVSTTDNDPENAGSAEETAEPIRSFAASDFTADGGTGLPRISTAFTSAELLNAAGISAGDLGNGDTVNLRWVLNLTTGKSFSTDNTGLNITGGAFYNSPFQRNIIIQSDEDE